MVIQCLTIKGSGTGVKSRLPDEADVNEKQGVHSL